MPPKKKKGKKGKKKKKTADGELTVEDKYKKSKEEMEALKDHLAFRKELTRRSRAQADDMKEQVNQMEEQLLNQQQTTKDISAEMNRKYKNLEDDMSVRVFQLETELARTRATLEKTELELKKTQEEKEKSERDKNIEIEQLKHKIDSMGMQYESVLNDALDKLIDKISDASKDWDVKSTAIQGQNKQTLLDFGLNPLEI